jgi:preprotein translocase subunit SecD
MRSRSIRLSIGILIILGIALAALGFKTINIDVPGFPEVNRDGKGPFGLKLGLDLRGGGHLVYQADSGTRFEVTFAEAINFNELSDALNDLRFGADELALEGLQIVPRDLRITQSETSAPEDSDSEAGETSASPEGESEAGEGETPETEPAAEVVLIPVVTRVQIRTALFGDSDPRRAELRDALTEQFGEISLFQASDIGEPTRDQMEGVLDNITRRVDRSGTEAPIIQIFGDDRIIVQLPGASGSVSEIRFSEPVTESDDLIALRTALEEAGFEDFEIDRRDDQTFRVTSNTVGSDIQSTARNSLTEQIGPVESFEVNSGIDEAKKLIGQTASLEFKERTCQTELCINFTDADLGLSGDDLSRAEAGTDPIGLGWVINIQFRGRGTEIFSDLTRRIQNVETKRIAVFMDDDELVAPVARAWIRDGRTQVSGNFTRDEARTLAIQLESGRLPVPLKLIQESDVDALLGSESLRNSLLAGLVGLGLVLVFMVVYYRIAGVVAAMALVFYAIVVLAIFKMIPITLELAHIGGFILSVGMAVDANVLIFERMKEEVRIGRTLASSMEVGFSRAWPAIRDSNISTMITCLVLLWFGDRLGGGLVTGVAISLFIGVAVSMFTAVIVSRNLLQVMAWVGLGGRINLFTPEPVQRTVQPIGGSR